MPAKGRQFVMKGMMQKEEQPIEEPHREEPKIKTDAEGEDRAYTQGDTYTEDNKLYVAGSHTPTDWFDDVTKIPQWQYVPTGLNGVVDIMNSSLGRKILGTGDLRQAARYKAGREALVSNKKNRLGWRAQSWRSGCVAAPKGFS